MPFEYKKVLVIGATSGIGKTLATKLVENGTQIIISGRRKENLDAFVEQHSAEKVQSKVFDIMKLDQVINSCQNEITSQTNTLKDSSICIGNYRGES